MILMMLFGLNSSNYLKSTLKMNDKNDKMNTLPQDENSLVLFWTQKGGNGFSCGSTLRDSPLLPFLVLNN